MFKGYENLTESQKKYYEKAVEVMGVIAADELYENVERVAPEWYKNPVGRTYSDEEIVAILEKQNSISLRVYKQGGVVTVEQQCAEIGDCEYVVSYYSDGTTIKDTYIDIY